ncbi:MAG: prenyltransferase/squalene oxidase repeat-containing protein [Candidatus Helarchaeota archaeon]
MLFPISKIDRIQILPSLKLGEYLLKHQRVDGSFGNLADTFWAVFALAYLRMVDSVDKDSLLKYVLDCKRINGFAANSHESEIDLHSIFYAVNILFLINKQKILSIEEYESIYQTIFNFQRKNGGFAHCNLDFCPICKGRASLKSTFFAISCLKHLYDINSIDANKILGFLSKKISKNDANQAFRLLSLLLLDHIEEIEEASITSLINLQESNGGFKNLEFSFWVVYSLDILKRLRNINKGKLFEYLRSCQKADGGFSALREEDHTAQLNIRTTAWATITLLIIWNELVDFIEQKLLLEIYTKERILLEEIAEQCYIKFDVIVFLVKNLMRYDWFRVEIKDTTDIFKEYVKKFDAVSRRIAIYIVKYIVNQNFVNLSELAKMFNASNYSKALQRVISVAETLLKEKFIIGEIKWNKRFFRVTAFLNGVLPGKALVRYAQIPYHEVIVEKSQVPIEQRRIQETIEIIKPFTEKIRSEIDNLLDLNEVELAKTHLKKNITEALRILNSSNQNIESNLSKFQYLNGEYTHYLMKDWISIYHQTKNSLLQIEKEYLVKIQNKERIVQILRELEKFQIYVQEQLNTITDELNTTQKMFQQACEEQTLEHKKDEIKKRLDSLTYSVEQITPQLRQQASRLFKASGELRQTQNASQTGALQPLEKWLESMWMKKRKNTLKIITDIKAHLNGRNELKQKIMERHEVFESKLDELKKIINTIIESNQFSTANTILNEKTEEILNYLSDSNYYILNFIQDTSSYLEGFQVTVTDIFENWSKTLLENMRNELNSVKKDLEEKILSKKELERVSQLKVIIEKNITEVKNAIASMEKKLFEFLQSPNYIDVLKKLKSESNQIEEMQKVMSKEIEEFIKTTLSEFQNFHKNSKVVQHKWFVFQESLKQNISLISDKIKNMLILKLLLNSAPLFRGGRIKFDYLASKLNLKKDEIEDRVVYLVSIGKLEAQFDKENNEVIPLTTELKKILQFERMVKNEMESLKKEYERTKRLFETSCKKRQLDDKVIEEIIGRTKGVLSQKYKTEVTIEERLKQLPQHIDLDLLLNKWLSQKANVEHDLNAIKQKITKRLEFKEKLLQSIKKIKSHIDELPSPIEMKIDFGDILEADKLLSKNINQIENEIRKYDKDLKLMVKKISNYLVRFDLVVADLLVQWSYEKTKLKTDLSAINARLKERINESLTVQFRDELDSLIHNCNAIVTNFLSNYEKEVNLLIQKGEIPASLSSLKNYHKKYEKIEENCESQLKYFINSKSKTLKSFKDTAILLLSRWELSKQEHQRTFQENYLQLENQVIIKYLQIHQTVFETTRLSLSKISKKLHMKKNELRQRFIALISAKNLTGKLDPNTDEYIFPQDKIQDAKLESPPTSLIQTELPSIPLKNAFWLRIMDLFRKWYYIIGSVGSVTSASITLYVFTNNIILPLLIPSLVFPTLFIYAYYTQHKKKDEEN